MNGAGLLGQACGLVLKKGHVAQKARGQALWAPAISQGDCLDNHGNWGGVESANGEFGVRGDLAVRAVVSCDGIELSPHRPLNLRPGLHASEGLRRGDRFEETVRVADKSLEPWRVHRERVWNHAQHGRADWRGAPCATQGVREPVQVLLIWSLGPSPEPWAKMATLKDDACVEYDCAAVMFGRMCC